MTFQLSGLSIGRLKFVNPKLIDVVNAAALAPTAQEFIVSEGVRGDADQLLDFIKHASKLNGIPIGQTQMTRYGLIHGTGRGNHQLDLSDHTGHAVDLAPVINGVVWGVGLTDEQKWEHCYPIADQMRAAAISHGTRIRWGGDWDQCLNDMPGGVDALKAARAAYVERFKAAHAGRPPLADGPHFELHA